MPSLPEKSSTFVNMEGRIIQSTKCFQPIGESKDEWKIFRALSEKFEKNLLFNNITELREEITSNLPLFKEINSLPSKSILNFGTLLKIKKRDINYNINNFYMTDPISRASITMANCTKEILNKVVK